MCIRDRLAIDLNNAVLKPFLKVALVTVDEMSPQIDQASEKLKDRVHNGVRKVTDAVGNGVLSGLGTVPYIGNILNATELLANTALGVQGIVDESVGAILDQALQTLIILQRVGGPGIGALDGWINFVINANNAMKNFKNQYDKISAAMEQKDFTKTPLKTKESLISNTKKQIEEYEKQYSDGLITRGEKYNKVVDAWSECTNRVADKMLDVISNPEDDKPINSVYMMAHSGARGSAAQLKQLAGMRGLMAKPSGEIIENPIKSNFKEGLSVLEYFTSTHGARKGLADTALKTASSGYLTRRLVDVAQDAVIRELDCGTKNGVIVEEIVDSGNITSPLSERVLGRTPSEDIKDLNNNLIIQSGHIIEEKHLEEIKNSGLRSMKIRSVLTLSLIHI